MATGYYTGIPDIPYRDFPGLVTDIGGRYEDRIALRDGNREWSYRRLTVAALGLAEWLDEYGIESGSKIAILSENRFEWIAAYLGICTGGYVAVPFNFRTNADEIAAWVRACDIRAVAASPRYNAVCRQLKSRNPRLVIVGMSDGVNVTRDSQYIIGGSGPLRGGQSFTPKHLVDPSDPASIAFTSGNSERAKAAVLSHRGVLANVNAAIQSLLINRDDVFVAVMPFHNIYGLTCGVLAPLAIGAGISLTAGQAGSDIAACARRDGGTVLLGLPRHLLKLKGVLDAKLRPGGLAASALIGARRTTSRVLSRFLGSGIAPAILRDFRESAGLSTLRLIVSGGYPLDYRIERYFREYGFVLVQGYGLAENSPLVSVNTIANNRSGSVGLPVKYTDVKIIDPDQEGIGEIAVRSPSLCIGYSCSSDGTTVPLTEDGFLRTGDRGRIEDDYLFITGRM